MIVSFEIVPGDRQPVVRFTGNRAAAAAQLWAQCCLTRGASFRAIESTGEEFGTKRADEFHGLAGVFTERCAECGREFRTPMARIGDSLCPGCELVHTTEAEEAWW